MILDKRLDKQLEIKAQTYTLSLGVQKEEFEQNKKEYIKQYLITHPKIEKQYKERKQHLLKISKRIALGGILLSGVAGVSYSLSIMNTPEDPQIKIYSEDIEQNINTMETKEANQPNTQLIELQANRTQENINQHRKQAIVEQYNKQHPEAQITADRLEIIQSDLYLIANVDKFGNEVSYQRKLVNDMSRLPENQKVENGIAHYLYKIDGQIVAIYTKDGVAVQLENGNKSDEFFKDTVNIVNKSIAVKVAYNTQNEQEKQSAEEAYIKAIQEYTSEKEPEKENINQIE